MNVTMPVAKAHGETFLYVDVTVDTTCDYTTLPREMLQRLAVPVSSTAISGMADGRLVPSDTGWARVRLESREIYTPVIFTQESEANKLGFVALAEASLGVDPTNRRLIPVNLRRY